MLIICKISYVLHIFNLIAYIVKVRAKVCYDFNRVTLDERDLSKFHFAFYYSPLIHIFLFQPHYNLCILPGRLTSCDFVVMNICV